MKQAIEES